jgi:hypothetical protein
MDGFYFVTAAAAVTVKPCLQWPLVPSQSFDGPNAFDKLPLSQLQQYTCSRTSLDAGKCRIPTPREIGASISTIFERIHN